MADLFDVQWNHQEKRLLRICNQILAEAQEKQLLVKKETSQHEVYKFVSRIRKANLRHNRKFCYIMFPPQSGEFMIVHNSEKDGGEPLQKLTQGDRNKLLGLVRVWANTPAGKKIGCSGGFGRFRGGEVDNVENNAEQQANNKDNEPHWTSKVKWSNLDTNEFRAEDTAYNPTHYNRMVIKGSISHMAGRWLVRAELLTEGPQFKIELSLDASTEREAKQEVKRNLAKWFADEWAKLSCDLLPRKTSK